jgi:hypothetical protein
MQFPVMGGVGFPGCTYGSGSCGGMIYGFGGDDPETLAEGCLEDPQGCLDAIEEATSVSEEALNDFWSLLHDAEEQYLSKAGKWENHHIIPQYLTNALNAAESPTVSIPAAYHQLITTAWQQAIPYATKAAQTWADVSQVMVDIYSKFPLLW